MERCTVEEQDPCFGGVGDVECGLHLALGLAEAHEYWDADIHLPGLQGSCSDDTLAELDVAGLGSSGETGAGCYAADEGLHPPVTCPPCPPGIVDSASFSELSLLPGTGPIPGSELLLGPGETPCFLLGPDGFGGSAMPRGWGVSSGAQPGACPGGHQMRGSGLLLSPCELAGGLDPLGGAGAFRPSLPCSMVPLREAGCSLGSSGTDAPPRSPGSSVDTLGRHSGAVAPPGGSPGGGPSGLRPRHRIRPPSHRDAGPPAPITERSSSGRPVRRPLALLAMDEGYEEEDHAVRPAKRVRPSSGAGRRGAHRSPRRAALGAKAAADARGKERSSSDDDEGNPRRKQHNPWNLEETTALIEGVERCGGGRWAEIKKLGMRVIERRSAVDLKDKWRNLLRVALMPQSAHRSKCDKKREVPWELLDRVRAVAQLGHTAHRRGGASGPSGPAAVGA